MSDGKLDYQKLALQLDQLKQETMAKVGQEDANYIRQLIRLHRVCEWGGRLLMLLGVLLPSSLFILWGMGVLLLATAKILDNMEIGHNVMHGQYDWMNDKQINSKTYEWDIVCDGQSWHRTHNYEHHTYTNILGKDKDLGYGVLRLSDDFHWQLSHLWQFLTYLSLSVVFQWGVAYQGVSGALNKKEVTRRFFSKSGRQLLKDYLVFPLFAGPFFLWIMLGNFFANLIRNLWTSTIIFCGHFTDNVKVFTEQECENESKGHWYYRQALGSSNITGASWFHVLTGHLSFQIEHHLFPDIPAKRYPQMSSQVQQIFAEHGLHYNTGSFWRQYSSVVKRIMRYSLP